jgi:hypothetical protein
MEQKNKQDGCAIINYAATASTGAEKVTFCHKLDGNCDKCKQGKNAVLHKVNADEEAFIKGKISTPGHLCQINGQIGLVLPETIEVFNTKNPKIKKVSVILPGNNQKPVPYAWGVVNFLLPGQKEHLEKLYLANPGEHRSPKKRPMY